MANDKQKNEQYIYQQTQNAIRNHSNQQNDLNIAWDKLQAVIQLNAAEQNATDSFEKRQLQEKLDLMKAKDVPRPSTANITNEAIKRSREQEKNIREQAKNDAIFKMTYRPRIEASLKGQGRDITQPNWKAYIEKTLDERLLAAKLQHRQEQMAQKRPQSAPLPQTQPQVKQNSTPLQSQQVSKQVVAQVLKSDVGSNAALQRRNEQARQRYAQQLEQQKASNQRSINFQSQQFAKFALHDNSLASLNKQASFHSQSQQSFYPSLITPITPYPDLGQTKSSSALSQTPSISSAQTRKAPSVNEQKFNGYPSL